MLHRAPVSALSVLACSLLLAACQSLPTSGPSAARVNAINNTATETQLPKVEILHLDDAVSLHLAQNRPPQSLADLGGGSGNPDAVDAGDILEITIWEAPPAVLFGGSLSSAGAGAAQTVKLPEQMVGSNGQISVPFLGSLNVRGRTPAQIQNEIVAKLHRKANQPQALVRVVQNNSGNVTVIRAGRSVRMPLTGHRERVLDALAAVGGTESDIQNISLQLTRGTQVRTVALETVTADPSQNITLRSGDVLTLIANPLSITALGAVGQNRQIRFAARGINLAEALGEMGGLQDRRSDARGVFVFRYQPLSQLPAAQRDAWLAQGYQSHMDIPVVYRVNLREPHSLFWLQRFQMQDKDIVYIANAPASELNKFLQLIFSPVTTGVNSINNLAQ